MTDILRPIPDGQTRKHVSKRVRDEATRVATNRVGAVKQSNNGEAKEALHGDDAEMVAAHGTFSKGLAHDNHGRVKRGDLRALVAGLNQFNPANDPAASPFPGTYTSGKPAEFDVPLYKGGFKRPQGDEDGKARTWESPISGHTFDLLGPDADQLAMPAAPVIGSSELTGEIAEVYGAALIRDVPFDEWKSDTTKVGPVVAALNHHEFFATHDGLDEAAKKRRAARFGKGETKVTVDNLFRGSTRGAQTGPYISQFMLVGTEGRSSAAPDFGTQLKSGSSKDGLNRAAVFVPPSMRSVGPEAAFGKADDEESSVGEMEGFIRFGTQPIAQTMVPHAPEIDHMIEWQTWLDVQNGANRKDGFDYYATKDGEPDGELKERFITTPRDLATYVHFDALYQAYLNACLLMLGREMPTDAGLPEGKGHPTRDAFATFGGPHILTLVTEVATRALKAVRRQKYNIHLRSRPEVIAAGVALAWSNDEHDKNQLGGQKHAFDKMVEPLDAAGLLSSVSKHNKKINKVFWRKNGWPVEMGPLGDDGDESKNALLPMAFPEGSPMHPAYGAGHATVAGACVTILKAFFEMFDIGDKRNTFSLHDIVTKHGGYPAKKFPEDLFGAERKLVGDGGDQFDAAYIPDKAAHHTKLKSYKLPHGEHLTVQGELDKLAANIAIGRNFAGVHFYTDYYESLRMGERLAVGILQEQMLTYREPVSMRFMSFDGDYIMLAGTGGSQKQDDALVYVWDEHKEGGTKADFQKWWSKHQI